MVHAFDGKRNHLHIRGESLLEVLIALVVISTGVLGLIAIQATVMRLQQASYWQGEAVAAAADLIERLRADPVAAARGSYDPPAPPATRCPQAPPTGNYVWDGTAWAHALRCRVPDGRAVLTRSGGTAQLRLSWDDRGEPPDGRTLAIATAL